jgi:hypothetical protein
MVPDRQRINLVRGCEICATVVCFSAQDVEGIGRVIGMTTWKNLGGINKSQWPAWYAHHSKVDVFADLCNRKSSSTRDKMTRDLRKGTSIFAAFEGIGNPPSDVVLAHWYTPMVSRRATSHLTGDSGTEDNWHHHAPIFGTWCG